MQDIINKIEIGDHLSDLELEKAIKWYSELEHKLVILGNKYYIAWYSVFYTLNSLKSFKFHREFK